jgi:hypothetical protein
MLKAAFASPTMTGDLRPRRRPADWLKVLNAGLQEIGLRVHLARPGSVGLPKGPEFDFSLPGKPLDPAFTESFRDKFPSEYLNAHSFMSLEAAKFFVIEYCYLCSYGPAVAMTPVSNSKAAI